MVTCEANSSPSEADAAHPGPRHAGHREAVDDDVRGVFEVDAVLAANGIGLVHEHARLGEELDGSGCCAAGLQLEADVVAGADGDAIARTDVVGRILERSPGGEGRADIGVVAIEIDEIIGRRSGRDRQSAEDQDAGQHSQASQCVQS